MTASFDEEERLRAESDRLRADLLRTARELDRRARRTVAVVTGLPRNPALVGALAAFAVAVAGLTVVAVARRLAEALAVRRRARWRPLLHA